MKKIHFIWLDDERPIRDAYKTILNKATPHHCDIAGWSLCRTGEEAIKELASLSKISNCKIFISFDHDLGQGINGYDVAKWIIENEIQIAGFTVHSMNPVGRQNIISLLTHYGYKEMTYYSDIVNF